MEADLRLQLADLRLQLAEQKEAADKEIAALREQLEAERIARARAEQLAYSAIRSVMTVRRVAWEAERTAMARSFASCSAQHRAHYAG